MNNQWMDNPALNGISDEKLEILNKILSGSSGMDPKQMLTYFIRESNNASKNGITFTNEETDAILSVLKTRMKPEDVQKIDMLKKMVAMISKKK